MSATRLIGTKPEEQLFKEQLSEAYVAKAKATNPRKDPVGFAFWCMLGASIQQGICIKCVAGDSSKNESCQCRTNHPRYQPQPTTP